MKTPIPANADACPQPSRRGFLHQLAKLPLIGGGVALIGAPSAVAEPVTLPLLETYATWLFYERRMVSIEMAKVVGGSADEFEHYVMCNAGSRYFFGSEERFRNAPPMDRAALVLSAVGCNWRGEG